MGELYQESEQFAQPSFGGKDDKSNVETLKSFAFDNEKSG
jgi:hypothetical protein